MTVEQVKSPQDDYLLSSTVFTRQEELGMLFGKMERTGLREGTISTIPRIKPEVPPPTPVMVCMRMAPIGSYR